MHMSHKIYYQQLSKEIIFFKGEISLEINRVVHNVLVNCALLSVTALSIAGIVFIVRAMSAVKHVEEFTQNFAQSLSIEGPCQSPADIVKMARDAEIAAENLRNITDQLVQTRRPDDPNPENAASIIRAINNIDKIAEHLQRPRDRNNSNNENIPIVIAVNNIQDISQAVAHPISSTSSGMMGVVRGVGRMLGLT